MEAPVKLIFAGLAEDVTENLLKILRQSGFAPVTREVASRTKFIDALDLASWDAVLADCRKGQLSPSRLADILKQRRDETPLIILCKDFETREAVEMVKSGASDVLCLNEVARLPNVLKREIKNARKRWKERSRDGDLRVAAAAFKTAAEGIMVTDRTGRIIAVNPAFTTLTGVVLSAAIGRSPEILYADNHTPSFFASQQEKLSENGIWKGEAWLRRTDGDRFPVWMSTTVVTNTKGEITEYVSVFRDISERKEREERFRRLATYDPLTELPNRTLFFDRIEQLIRAASRNETAASLLFIDLDRFKGINDSHGHRVGDQLLKQVAHRLRRSVRESDTVARIGGDEFAIVLEDDQQGSAAVRVAQKTIAAIKRPFNLNGTIADIGCSIGISRYPQDGDNGEVLLGKADEAMYQAKNRGKGCYHFFEAVETPAGILKKITLENRSGSLPALTGVVLTALLITWLALSGIANDWLFPENNMIADEPPAKSLIDFDTAAGNSKEAPLR